MTYQEKYKQWLQVADDAEMRQELLEIRQDEQEIKERFTKDLNFGTAGLRGILAAGTDRMNIYTVRRATQGLALYLKKAYQAPSVVIGYDSRHKSTLFAEESAKVLAANGIRVYLFNELKPVPEVSFAVRHLQCSAGIMITASHNPAKYNGYKVYGEDGAQIGPEVADSIVEQINRLDFFRDVKTDGDESLITRIGDEVEAVFLEEVYSQAVNPQAPAAAKDFKVIYTPFHGTGNKPVRKIFEKMGMQHVFLVEEQLAPDGDFPTVKSPNPEEKEGFTLAIQLAKEKNVDAIIGTDPDCDRVGVVVKDRKTGEYIVLTGNQTGALLTEYILSSLAERGTMPKNPVVIKTIVTTELIQAICDHYGVELRNVLTGFKFIGEQIKSFEETGSNTYVFGFEESYGYLKGTHARDKDGVVASMLVAEMAAFYSLKGMSLYDALMELYQTYGYYAENVKNIVIEGLDGAAKIQNMMKTMRQNLPATLGGLGVKAVRDYQTGLRTELATGETTPTGLPTSNVLYFELEDGSWAVLRPSGTEPKIKVYTCTNAPSVEAAQQKSNSILADFEVLK